MMGPGEFIGPDGEVYSLSRLPYGPMQRVGSTLYFGLMPTEIFTFEIPSNGHLPTGLAEWHSRRDDDDLRRLLAKPGIRRAH